MSGTLRHVVVPSPVDDLTLVADDDGLVAVLWADERRGLFPDVGPAAPTDPALTAATAQLREYFAGERRTFDLPLAPRGEAFAQRVWGLLRQIPFGVTRTYGIWPVSWGDPGRPRPWVRRTGRTRSRSSSRATGSWGRTAR